jgi:uncharacterized protein YdeI (YjbR/CyaY-like superfamily)
MLGGSMALHRRQIRFDTLEAWCDWLRRNYLLSAGLWVVLENDGPAEGDVIDVALRHGWVACALGRAPPAGCTKRWYERRRRGAGWTRDDKARVERLEAEGRLNRYARRRLHDARRDGSWSLFDDAESLAPPPDLVAAFDRHDGASAGFEQWPGALRRATLIWIAGTRRVDHRAGRVEKTARAAARALSPDEWIAAARLPPVE